MGDVRRRGKYLWFGLRDAEGPRGIAHDVAGDRDGLLVHLGMSGSLAWVEASAQPDRHDHFDLVTERGTLRLTDPRRFGAVLWSSALDREPASTLLASLGPEPFAFLRAAQSGDLALRLAVTASCPCRRAWRGPLPP